MRHLVPLLFVLCAALPLRAQELVFATVERPPFSFAQNGGVAGFSVDLMRAIGNEIGAEIRFEMKGSFAEMLGAVEAGRVDGAIANISITGPREAVMDFSMPIFRSGLQIMVPAEAGPGALWPAILTRELVLAALGTLAFLICAGMLLWVVPLGALAGRIAGLLLGVASLFAVAFLVANITTAMTVRAMGVQVDGIDDLEGRLVATTKGSTASAFLAQRDISHQTFVDYRTLIWAFEDGELDAVFFDAPLLAYYVATEGRGTGRLVERIFRPEDYGIALPQGSDLRERINVALLDLQADGTFEALYWDWFETGN